MYWWSQFSHLNNCKDELETKNVVGGERPRILSIWLRLSLILVFYNDDDDNTQQVLLSYVLQMMIYVSVVVVAAVGVSSTKKSMC